MRKLARRLSGWAGIVLVGWSGPLLVSAGLCYGIAAGLLCGGGALILGLVAANAAGGAE